MDYGRIAPMMGLLWSPIAAATSRLGDRANAQIAVAISAASMVPDIPRVVVHMYKNNYSHQLIYRGGTFALNFLRPDQLQNIKGFGLVSGRDVDKLSDVPHQTGSSGSPILADCWGNLAVQVVNAMDGDDMTCFLWEVLDWTTLSEGQLLWWRDARRAIPALCIEEWDRKIGSEIAASRERMKLIDHTPWKR